MLTDCGRAESQKNVWMSNSGLREWFNHDAKKFKEFSHKYDEELQNNEYVDKIRRILNRRNVTLIYAAKGENINHTAVLKDYILK